MNWSNVIRQSHRWIALAFTLVVLANVAAFAFTAEPPAWLYMLPLLPLALLLLSGIYLFILPYVARRRARGA